MDHEFIKEMVEVPNPKVQILTKPLQKVKYELPKYWDREYINQKLEQIKNHQHRMLLWFLWRTGVRVTEAMLIRKQDIDFPKYLITVRWLKSRKYQYRIVPIHPEVKNMLELYTASMLAEDLIFPWTRQRAWQLCKKHLNGHPHQLRHSFAVNWLRCKGDIVILHKILGHSDVKVTMEYLKIVPIDQGAELIKIQF